MTSSHQRITAITGGIGSGKSVVCRVLGILSYPVFDCDREAKLIMDSDPLIKQRLVSELSPLAVRPDGEIDRPHIASLVFADSERLAVLNSIVHSAVLRRLERWITDNSSSPRLFVETAILYESGLSSLVNDVWCITAPLDLRISRVMARNACSRDEVIARIQSQTYSPADPLPTVELVNDSRSPLLPEILRHL